MPLTILSIVESSKPVAITTVGTISVASDKFSDAAGNTNVDGQMGASFVSYRHTSFLKKSLLTN
jgi:hypothetical protein